MSSEPEQHSPSPTVEVENEKPENEKTDVSDIIVDWEGPDDPLNPKKLVCRLYLPARVSTLLTPIISAGAGKRNGPQRWWSLRSP
jgi:hypothetical protein